MKSAWKRIVAGFLVWSALAAGAAAWQTGETSQWQAWEGTPVPWKTTEEAERQIAEHRKWLAELRVKVMTGRIADVPNWEERLDRIRLIATSTRGVPSQRELLVDVASTRAEVFTALGRYDDARTAAASVLIAASDPVLPEYKRVAAPPELLAIAADALADPALAKILGELSGAGGTGSAQDEGLDEKLRDALRAGNVALVAQIGARAAPVLEDAIAANLSALPPENLGYDEFNLLAGVAERRAAQFALEHLDAGYPFRLRVVRSMTERLVFSARAWGEKPRGSDPRPALVPEWPLVLAGLLRHEDSASNALPLVIDMIHADGLSPEVTAALIAALQGPIGGELTSQLLQLLSSLSPDKGVSGVPLFEFLATREEPMVRRMAAQRLWNLGAAHALVARASDPDANVRAIVARSLASVADEQAEAALRALLRDASAEVRAAAASTLVQWPRALEPELYRAVAQDADAGVRRMLLWLNHPDDALVRDVLLSLVGEGDPDTRKEVDNRISFSETWKRPAVVLPAARVRVLDPTWPSDKRYEVIREMVQHDEGVRMLFAGAVAQPRSSLLTDTLQALGQFPPRLKAMLVLDDETLARSYLLLHEVSDDYFGELDRAIANAETPRWAAMLRMLEDQAAPAEVRLQAARHAAKGGGERFQAALLALLASEPLRSRQLSDAESKVLEQISSALHHEERNPLVLSALQNEALNDHMRAKIAGWYAPEGPLAREITLAILKRWLDAEDRRAEVAVGLALLHLRSLPEDADPALLHAALQKPWYAKQAAVTMTALQDPVFLPAIEELLRPGGEWDAQYAAIEGLTSFPGEQATEILLRAAATAPKHMRDFALTALDTRRRVEEQRQLWADSKEARLDREGAVEKLLTQLRDADAATRGQAARALATLGALETLPALIDLLKDADPEVRKAASEALERLNSLPRGG